MASIGVGEEVPTAKWLDPHLVDLKYQVFLPHELFSAKALDFCLCHGQEFGTSFRIYQPSQAEPAEWMWLA